MTDLEKVKKGLDLCLSGELSACKDCPYDIECKETICTGPSPLRRDALKLLEDQEVEIERLEHDLAVTEHNMNYYINGND